MSQQDDRPEDAATEWLSPALYRQLCDAVDAALSAPPDARDALLAARLGSDQRLLAEARALLASHEESPRTFITPAVDAGDDGTQELPAHVGLARRGSEFRDRDAAAAATARAESDRRHHAAPADRAGPAVTVRPGEPPGVGPRRAGTTAGYAAAPVAAGPGSPGASAAGPRAAARSGTAARRRDARHRAAPVRGSDVGAPIPVRRSGGSATGLIGLVVAGLLFLVAGGALWMWRQATIAQQDAEARVVKAEKRFAEVRQLGQRLAEVDHLLAVTPDPAAHTARAVLLRTWMQYLTDLQRASGSTDRELLIEVARGYRQLAASLGGSSGRTLGDRAGATRTLQIAENLWSYLDRTSAQPDRAVRQELIATVVDLGDLYAVTKDAGKASAQYQKALEQAGKLSAAGVGDADVKRITDTVRQRLQSGPPASAPAVVDAAPVTASEQP